MWRLFYTLYKQHDADFDLSGPRAEVDQDAAVVSLEFIQQLLDGTICTPSGDYGTAVSEFMSGESGMFFTGVWELPTAKNAGINFDAQPIPTLFGTPAAYADSHAFTLPHQSQPERGAAAATYQFVATSSPARWLGRGRAHPGVPAGHARAPSTRRSCRRRTTRRPPRSSTTTPRRGSPGRAATSRTTSSRPSRTSTSTVPTPRTASTAFVRRVNVQLAKPNPV